MKIQEPLLIKKKIIVYIIRMNKNDFDLIVKNNPKHPATVFENIVFIIDIIIFSIALLFSLYVHAYMPALGFLGFVLFGAVSLYFNNRVVAKLKGQKLYIKKFFKAYEFFLEDCTSQYCNYKLHEYIFNFAGTTFKIPFIYLNSKKMYQRIHIANLPFANEESFAALKEYLKSKTGRPCYKLLYRKDIEPDLFSSKLGGYPYWDFSKEYPVDSKGNKMQLLCQLNFDECGFKNDLLPKSGMLQFFITCNTDASDLYGINFKNPIDQSDWRIVYHSDIDKNITLQQIKDHLIPDGSGNECSPVLKTCALEFCESISYMKTSDYRFVDLLSMAVKDISDGTVDFIGGIYDLLGDTVYADELYMTLDESGCFMLGDPSFIQNDPRENFTEAEYFDTCLLQLDSDEQILMWGDCGIGNFMINTEDLKNLDFSKVLYNWDCY